MEAAWFVIVSGMLAFYAVLDGFDFGVGAIHRIVARNDEERRTVLAAIGPIWDGNEVWLIAAGGVLFMAFPNVYATAFSGFYMALIVVLWLLILRGVAIELRSHQDHPLWREFWDTVFMLASALLAVVFGTTLGNLIRGVPLGEEGLRGMPLFTNFLIGRAPGILDWYTGLVGLFTLAALSVHGALYLAWRTIGPVRERSVAFALEAWKAALVLWVAATAATAWVRPEVFTGLVARPWAFAFVALSIAGAWGAIRFMRSGRDLAAFLSSSAFLLGMLAATLAGQYPFWLRSTLDPSHSLTALNSASDHYGLRVALTWWPVGIALVAVYFTFLFRWMRGKVGMESGPSYGSAIAGRVDSPGQRV
ncbi:MAG TPA: cytochrome d ubiquinol oxidase subunit II [Isosphaeraceae bacterium]|jgi:cytochrome d ubiquinol oxidase subunit II|nr:cytochrome d ubiquinol oxidase subunit II [Isosphaeraceae bacterium]